MARRAPSVRSQARANFEKEEELARARKAKFGTASDAGRLVLGEFDRKSGKGKERVIDARAFGPAIRSERKRKPKRSDTSY